IVDGYLVYNSKCHIPSLNLTNRAMRKFVRKMEFEPCRSTPLLSSIVEQTNGRHSLTHPYTNSSLKDSDSKISVSDCVDFENTVLLPMDLETVMVSCRVNKPIRTIKKRIIYENIHAIVNSLKIQRSENKFASMNDKFHHDLKKMSILILGVDSVSRLNFLRSLPNTDKYLRETGWFNLKGYNKVGLNTFPNLMALLTGQNIETNAGYVTGHGEDDTSQNTFNFFSVGFVNPPTDYYLCPYIVASEKLLKPKANFNSEKYCTGPESAIDRIFNYAANFSKAFLNTPYFGFFWTNSISHDCMNGISSMDTETFVGGHEDRLPFIYLRIPKQHEDNDKITQALKINENRLTSHYDLHETLRDVLIRSGGKMDSSSGCPRCQSLFEIVPLERSCEDAGISSQYCTCTTTEMMDQNDKNIGELLGSKIFLDYVESVIEEFKNEKKERLYSQLQLKKIHQINEIIDVNNNNTKIMNKKYSYRLEVTPGGGMFEFVRR
ncbi:hypothetical protein PV326_009036, partial [Microctonus aethiopoides]